MTSADPFRDVRLAALRTLRGANYWSPFPVTRLDVAVGPYDEIPSDAVHGLPDALLAALPGLIEHRCSIGERGGFLTRLRRGTYVPHIVEHLALELQSSVGHDVGYGRARGGDRPGEYTVVFEHRHSAVGRRAGTLALELTQCAFAGLAVPAAAAIAELDELARTTDEPEVCRAVLCGVIGSGDRDAVRRVLLDAVCPAEGEVVDMAPPSVLESGLPYSTSRTAIVLDVDPGDVPERYRGAESAQRLASVVADAVPRGGIVVVPVGESELQAMILHARRRVAVFSADGELPAAALRLAHASARVAEGRIVIESRGAVREVQEIRLDVPLTAQLAATLSAFLIGENGD